MEAPDQVELHVVAHPGVGNEQEASRVGQHPRPALEQAAKQLAPAEDRGRLGEDQLYGQQGGGYVVDAVGEDQQALQALVEFGFRYPLLPLLGSLS
jgi:hypothetical protein